MQETINKIRRRACAANIPVQEIDPVFVFQGLFGMAAELLADVGSGDPAKDPPIEEWFPLLLIRPDDNK